MSLVSAAAASPPSLWRCMEVRQKTERIVTTLKGKVSPTRDDDLVSEGSSSVRRKATEIELKMLEIPVWTGTLEEKEEK